MANSKTDEKRDPAPTPAPQMEARPTATPLSRAEKRALWTTGAFWSQKPETD
ncbi:MAG: hypothetical protein H0T46_10490 [Deltaproteobacteria bacterium]|nr:hypothetical protein [Deltaproteobacteria bacterium]